MINMNYIVIHTTVFDFNHPPKAICRNASVVKFIASYMSHRDQMRNEKKRKNYVHS